jgi:hypothetical protein
MEPLTWDVVKSILEYLLETEIVKFKENKFGYIKFTTLSGETGKVEIYAQKFKWFFGKQSGTMLSIDINKIRSN